MTEIERVHETVDTSEKKLNPEEPGNTIEKEISEMCEYIEYQMARNQTLKAEIAKLSGYVDEDKVITTAASDYINTHDLHSSSTETEVAVDENLELLYKLKVLKKQLCNIIKKFSRLYFEDPGISRHSEVASKLMELASKDRASGMLSEASTSCAETLGSGNEDEFAEMDEFKRYKKSLLDILKALLPVLKTESCEDFGILQVDDTVWPQHIEFLISAGIIKRCDYNPSHVKLTHL